MIVISFESTHAAMAAQKLLAGLRFDVIPTPVDITATCGIALRLEDDLIEQAHARLQQDPNIGAQAAWHYV
ncbi:MAG: DUF3343 domain-containing protein [Coriobacteriales bacterium]